MRLQCTPAARRKGRNANENACLSAHNKNTDAKMNQLESENDYLIAGFDGDSTNMVLKETGKGGLSAVVAYMKENCEDTVGVGVFRVTAVDDRGVTTSYRTKLVHVTYVGPKLPVMKKAKVSGYNASFRGTVRGSQPVPAIRRY